MVQDDFYTFVTKDLVVQNSKNKHMFFSFKSNKEASNFLRYLKTNFARFALSLFKNNSQLDRGELEIVPWLDFTQEWTDEKLARHFELTKEEIDFINKHIPKYYE
jgi:site-specific DNA-methyltransferase (adenine-specific)